ncbi:cell envelope integrity protein TolA [Polynucleobacter paneuropaeus]|jgi:colicin import membrane protein|nr:cell envelope integrity protein TolA [Polynucleobacter paneuropaeus]MBT8576754.1 cell envelope integrity protein TolA [Polynucleobacter paneuropaeus]MBT8615144.1 cell envelope integrity protein TolA [Polynucleobacter paneuropaeus]MBT8616625.1 cell envelope integrity protein TolA [Polynucleobacter paneuropaeus]MBT8618506.1 cell envelope integrity protein TolA [Polynucleobacter paneuropaeus]
MNSAPLSNQSFSRYRFGKTESTKRALTFSLIAHLGLLAFLMIGIQWRSSTPAGVEVELWDTVPQVNTPATPETKTEAKEESADIAIKKKKLERESPKKEPVKEVVKPKPIPPPEKPAVKQADTPKALSPAEVKANAVAEKVRDDQLARLRAAAGAEGGSGGTSGSGVGGGGNAPPGWTDKVIKKVKPLIVFNAESVSGNPAAVIKVDLAPDGAILSTSIMTSSGIEAWDRAVLLALSRAQSLPKDDSGKIPQRQVKLTFKPKD